MAVQVLSPHPPHNADIHSIPHGQPEHSHTQSHAHADLEDKIPVAALDDGGPAIHPGNLTEPVWFKYEVVPGYFIQNGPKPKHLTFNQILDRNFGLLDTSRERWSNLKKAIERLQREAEEGVVYKVLFLGRHGQGWHNHAAKKFGVEEWEAKWTFLYGDGQITWGPDPALTPLGESQAANIHSAWQREEALGAPIHPGQMRWFVSPMLRACQTMLCSFGEFLPLDKEQKGNNPETWEDWREICGSHTCDQRSSKTTIQRRFPELVIEDGFSEEDNLWKPDEREQPLSIQTRGRRALDRVFGAGGAEETFVSITSHSEFFRNLLAVLNHQPYPLSTGEMIPVVVKATKVEPVPDGPANGKGHANGNGH